MCLLIVRSLDSSTRVLRLISLARVARVFARLLLREAQRSIWVEASQRANLPALKSQESSENPHSIFFIARILYDHHCREYRSLSAHRVSFQNSLCRG